jgi:meso-butanediol dehydrogenase/(S,S)-butanediol dehydrogenase/diacetyl reductase
MLELKLQGKVAIITGGAVGMGRACVEGFVREGANAVIADLQIEKAEELAKKMSRDEATVIAIKTDVSKQTDVGECISKTMEQFGKIDILVNNAGVGSKNIDFIDLPEEQWDLLNRVNAKGVFLMTKAVLPHMIAAQYGKIVNLASFYGKEGMPLAVDYCASKFAVIAITQSAAKEHAQYNININAVCPGIVRTDIWDDILEILSKRTGEPPEKVWREIVEGIPLKRPQTVEDIANLVLFLSSDISKNITGESISINGGLKMD